MLHSRDDNDKHVDLPTFPEDAEDARAEVPSVPDSQAEFLQGNNLILVSFHQGSRFRLAFFCVMDFCCLRIISN